MLCTLLHDEQWKAANETDVYRNFGDVGKEREGFNEAQQFVNEL